MTPLQLARKTKSLISDCFSDEYKDGVCQLPSKIPKEIKDIIYDLYTVSEIMVSKLEAEEGER
jgi:hypothetical protein